VPVIEVAGAELRYRFDGAPEAPVVMLANSLGTTLEMWDDQVAALEPHFRVLRYDMRGHGGRLGPEPFGVERLARDAWALLDALGLARVHFCGLSLGGVVGMWLGARAPERLDKLALCNTAATLGAATLWNARIAKLESGGMEAIASSVLERWFTAGFREREPERFARLQRMLLAMPPAGYARACAAARDADLRTDVQRVRPRSLVLSGSHDQATPPAEGRWLATNLPRARYAELPVAHLSNIEAPAAFNQLVLDFLTAPGERDG
jgi:3-oxoadipate enol-lactonase